jgi:hypothetical protein
MMVTSDRLAARPIGACVAAHRSTCLPAHAVKGVAEAMLSGVTNVEAGRYEGAAFTSFFIHDTIRTRRKVHNPNGGRCFLNCHPCKKTREEDDGHSHTLPS